MGFFDIFSDLYDSLSVQTVQAEEAGHNPGPSDESHVQSVGKDTNNGGVGPAQHGRGGAVAGGASASSPALGDQQESDEEAEVNKQDIKNDQGSGEKGHVAGSGGEASGQKGVDYVPKKAGGDDEEEEEEEGGDEEEEEEEEEEPEDLKPKFEEGKPFV
jgi:ubiquinol-cytochrome c reductase subunit 6